MKNLLKILLILAFASPVFATSTAQFPDPTTITADQISAIDAQAWIASLITAGTKYSDLSADAQNWIMSNATNEQKTALGVSQ